MSNVIKRRNACATALVLCATIIGLGGAAADQVIPDDLIVQGSTCVGLDCKNNESFGFDTLLLKEHSTRIRFDDTSAAPTPNNDWQLTANDSAIGGVSRFSIEDVTGAKIPFTVRAGAPTNSFFMDDNGKIGMRTGAPALDLHVNTGNTPAIRLQQNAGGGFTPQTWDIGANETNFFVRDAIANRLPIRVGPGAPTNSLRVSSGGAVGLGTDNPQGKLHLFGDSKTDVIATLGPSYHAGTDGLSITYAGNSLGAGVSMINAHSAKGDAAKLRFATDFYPRLTIDNTSIRIGNPVATGQAVDVAGGLTMTEGLHVGSLPTYGANACRSMQGETVAGMFSIGDCASDARLKRDIAYLGDGALEKVLALKPASFAWNADPTSARHAGFIAQDTLPHMPEAVGVNRTDGYYTWDSNAVLSYTVKALQELNRKVDGLVGTAAGERAAPSADRSDAVIPAGLRAGRPAEASPVVAELVAVIEQQQRRIEALERIVTR